jgi:hypothetical protein
MTPTLRTALRTTTRLVAALLTAAALLAGLGLVPPAPAAADTPALCPADRPCITTLTHTERGGLVATWTGGWEAYNIRWESTLGPVELTDVGGRKEHELVGPVDWDRTFRFSVQGCNRRFLAPSECSPFAAREIDLRVPQAPRNVRVVGGERVEWELASPFVGSLRVEYGYACSTSGDVSLCPVREKTLPASARSFALRQAEPSVERITDVRVCEVIPLLAATKQRRLREACSAEVPRVVPSPPLFDADTKVERITDYFDPAHPERGGWDPTCLCHRPPSPVQNPTPGQAPSQVPGAGVYVLSSRNYASLALDGNHTKWTNNPGENRHKVYPLAPNGLTFQQWALEPGPDGYVFLKNLATGFYLDSGANGDTYAHPRNGGGYQQWKPEPSGDGYVVLRNRQTGRVLANGGTSGPELSRIYTRQLTGPLSAAPYEAQWKLSPTQR